jgi:cytosine/adenosine deaminase-related metal-dependent hydrolase
VKIRGQKNKVIPNPEFNMESYSITANRIHTMTNVDGGTGSTGLLERHYINIVNGKIVSVSTKPEFANITDFADKYDILPGMINAHAHLELSQLKSPTQKYCNEFDQWIKQVVQFRRSPEYDPVIAISTAKCFFEQIHETAAVVDIVPFDLNPNQLDIGNDVTWFRYPELIAWDSVSVTKKIGQIRELPKNYYSGLSPHAPHTAAAELVEFAANFGVGVAMHLAESPDEMRLLKSRDGKLLEMMRKVDENYDLSKILIGSKAMDYLQVLSNAPITLIIHGNYLVEEEIRFLAEHRETMAVVYTPRSHDYFGFDEFPLQKMLDLRVRVLLGTDSKASTADLCLSNEIKYAASVYPEIPLEIFFQMATIQPANFLGITQNYGTIEYGKNAIFTLF